MPPRKRKSSPSGGTLTKKAKTTTSTTTIPDCSKTVNNSLISSDVLHVNVNVNHSKKEEDAIAISDDEDNDDDEELVNMQLLGSSRSPSSPNSFYSSGTGNFSTSPVQQNLNRLFDSYRDKSDQQDKIFIDGVQKYLNNLDIALEECVHLALCDLLSCPSIGEIDREAFVAGWTLASTPSSTTNNPPAKPLDTISRQQTYISILRKRLPTDPAYFKTVYRSSFKLAKQNESARSIPLEAAVDFWRLFFSSSSGGIEWSTKSTPWLEMWCEFYENQVKRPVNKDLWNMVGELVQKTKEPGGESLEWWTEDGAWPMAVDEFVSWVKEKRKASAPPADAMETD